MTEMTRVIERLEDYKKAFKRLQQAFDFETEDVADIIIDGTIQRFEFTFELAWKLMKSYLEYTGFTEAKSPRSTIRLGYQEGLIEDGDGWIDMMVDRNKTSNIYDEEEAKKIYLKIKKEHSYKLERLLIKLSEVITLK